MNATCQTFSVGPLSFRFERDTGFVRNIRFEGHEVLRGIYPAIRDSDWATILPKVDSFDVQSTSDSVRLCLKARVVAPEIDLTWGAEIEARATGRLKYTWQGNALRKSTTNRTGLCILHPAEAAGTPCVVEHTNGSRKTGCFPLEISPHQPFRDIHGMTYGVNSCCEISLSMDGEIFEMEDQRNWTDASFKTYCRPLDWPRPYCLEARAEVEQSVTMEVRQTSAKVATGPGVQPKEPTSLRLPEIGFTLPSPIPSALRDRMRALRPAHVRVETTQDTIGATLKWAGADAAFLDSSLVLAIRGAGKRPVELSSLPPRCTLHLFDEGGNTASSETLAAWHRAGHSSIGTGTLHNFVELNRNPPPAGGPQRLTVFGINAQVHASDNDSVLETLTQHFTVARTAYKIGAGRPVAVAPISIGRKSGSIDSRVRELFGAEWLLESLKRLAEAPCVETVTYFHAHGPAGFMDEHVVTPVERLLLALAGRNTIPSNFSLPA